MVYTRRKVILITYFLVILIKTNVNKVSTNVYAYKQEIFYGTKKAQHFFFVIFLIFIQSNFKVRLSKDRCRIKAGRNIYFSYKNKEEGSKKWFKH